MVGSFVLGSSSAAAGSMMAAAPPLPASLTVEWIGPFEPAEAMFIGQKVVYMRDDDTTTVTTAQMLDLAPSDPDWWVIVGWLRN